MNGANESAVGFALPINEDLSRFELGYIPEQFTKEEIQMLTPFFTNVDKPIFCIYNLPEEVMGALSSLYSRSTSSMRRVFLDYFVGPIVDESATDKLSPEEKEVFFQTRARFQRVIFQMNNGDRVDAVANTERGRAFYETWLGLFGDDSIGELAGFHTAMEGVSNLVTDAIKAVNLPHITKSTRYVDFGQRDALGRYGFVIPGEVQGTNLEGFYAKTMEELFSLYTGLQAPYREYIERLYPKGDDETAVSFSRSRGARVFDDLRSLLPFSTKTNFGMYANARTYSLVIDRMLASPLAEVRWAGQSLYGELKKIGPSLVGRAETQRGGLLQTYLSQLHAYKASIGIQKELNDGNLEKGEESPWVHLLRVDPESGGEERVLAQLLFERSNISYEEVEASIKSLSSDEKKQYFERLFEVRRNDIPEVTRLSIKLREIPEAFEAVRFTFAGLIMGGDARDLKRHRMIRFLFQPFTTQYGYLLEKDMQSFDGVNEIRNVLRQAHQLHQALQSEAGADVAQYAVPFAFLQRFILEASVRQLYWIGELRSGPQGRMHYANIVKDLVRQAMARYPLLFTGNYTDLREQAPISRRESELKRERKRKSRQ